MPYKDKEKAKEYHQKWWAEHREEMKMKRNKFGLAKTIEFKKEQYERSKAFLRNYLAQKRAEKV